MTSLSRLLSEADELIQTKIGGVTKAEERTLADDDIFKLAEAVRSPQAAQTKEASSLSDDEVFTLTEKIAHAAAIMDTWNNLPVIAKMAEFEKEAAAKGFSKEQIASYFEKNAAAFPLTSILAGK